MSGQHGFQTGQQGEMKTSARRTGQKLVQALDRQKSPKVEIAKKLMQCVGRFLGSLMRLVGLDGLYIMQQKITKFMFYTGRNFYPLILEGCTIYKACMIVAEKSLDEEKVWKLDMLEEEMDKEAADARLIVDQAVNLVCKFLKPQAIVKNFVKDLLSYLNGGGLN